MCATSTICTFRHRCVHPTINLHIEVPFDSTMIMFISALVSRNWCTESRQSVQRNTQYMTDCHMRDGLGLTGHFTLDSHCTVPLLPMYSARTTGFRCIWRLLSFSKVLTFFCYESYIMENRKNEPVHSCGRYKHTLKGIHT